MKRYDNILVIQAEAKAKAEFVLRQKEMIEKAEHDVRSSKLFTIVPEPQKTEAADAAPFCGLGACGISCSGCSTEGMAKDKR